MKNIFKNKIVLVVIVVVIILGGVGFFLMQGKGGSSTEDSIFDETQEVKQLSPEDIGLTLTPKQNGEVIGMQIANLEGVESIEYEVSYDAEVEDGGDVITVPRGVAGAPIEVGSKSEIEIDIDLGTCSRNVCKYDNVVSEVKFAIRINYSNGEIGGVEATVSLDN